MARHSKIAFLLLHCCFGSVAQSQEPNAGKGTLYGTVFLRDSQGAQSFVAGAKVKLTGAATLESESDTNGEFVIVAVPNGTFTVEVNWPGLKAIETVQVDSRNVYLSIELKPEQLVTSVVVKADPSENVSAASSQTISDTTLRDAPNVDDRFESALPLVPGVVRVLTEFDALDTGMFLCSPALFDRLEEAKKKGNCSLSDGMRRLSQERKLKGFDIGEGHWQDVDTPEAFAHTERIFDNDFSEVPVLQGLVDA